MLLTREDRGKQGEELELHYGYRICGETGFEAQDGEVASLEVVDRGDSLYTPRVQHQAQDVPLNNLIEIRYGTIQRHCRVGVNPQYLNREYSIHGSTCAYAQLHLLFLGRRLESDIRL